MASSFGAKIDNLRTRSRVLLTCLEENAKVVRKEVKKLRNRQKDPSANRGSKKRHSIYGAYYSDIWKLRNDSSGVRAALCPERFRLSPKYESSSAPDMMSAQRRLLIKPDRKDRQLSPQRKPIKECYCYSSIPETRKINQRSARTRHKLPEQISGENEIGIRGDGVAPRGNNCESYEDKERDFQNAIYSPPLSSATLRRAQKIDYTPRSQFLRRVQSKINSLRSSPRDSSPSKSTPRSPSPLARRNQLLEKKSKHVDGVPHSRREFPRKHNCQCVDKDVLATFNKVPKKTLLPKKTITSNKSTNDWHERVDPRKHGCKPTLRSSPPQIKKAVRVSARERRSKSKGKISDEEENGTRNTKGYKKICPCSEYPSGNYPEDIDESESPFASEINDVRKFRDKNYFDTHASSVSLLGSRSSGSLQQFRLNERLFPEPLGRVHREDLVVSIPPCATRQKRGIHYFPRGIIRQEKPNPTAGNTVRKRRCPSCPLIGHAIDLGALKITHPPNSLALRYQTGIR